MELLKQNGMYAHMAKLQQESLDYRHFIKYLIKKAETSCFLYLHPLFCFIILLFWVLPNLCLYASVFDMPVV